MDRLIINSLELDFMIIVLIEEIYEQLVIYLLRSNKLFFVMRLLDVLEFMRNLRSSDN